MERISHRLPLLLLLRFRHRRWVKTSMFFFIYIYFIICVYIYTYIAPLLTSETSSFSFHDLKCACSSICQNNSSVFFTEVLQTILNSKNAVYVQIDAARVSHIFIVIINSGVVVNNLFGIRFNFAMCNKQMKNFALIGARTWGCRTCPRYFSYYLFFIINKKIYILFIVFCNKSPLNAHYNL